MFDCRKLFMYARKLPGLSWSFLCAKTQGNFLVRNDGTLWACGPDEGFLGMGDSVYITSLQKINDDIKHASMGYSHSLIIKTDGTLWATGLNNNGQLGLGDNITRTGWTQIGTDRDWAFCSAGMTPFSLAIKNDGTLWACGSNSSGQLGLDDEAYRCHVFTRIGTGTDWVSCYGGNSYSMAIRTDGSLWATGYNNIGQLGLGDTTTRKHFTQVSPAGIGWKYCSLGETSSLAIRADGTLWSCGDNTYGQLGHGDTTKRLSMTQVGSENDWIFCSINRSHSLAIRAETENTGTLWGTGMNGSGQLGLGDRSNRSSFTQIGADNDWANCTTGYYHSLMIKSNGTLWGSGYNSAFILGADPVDYLTAPGRIGTDADWKICGAQFSSSCAIKNDHSIWACGKNYSSKFGFPAISNYSFRTQVGTDKDWKMAFTDMSHSLAIKKDGTLWGSGTNSQGCLGLGIMRDYIPVFIQLGADRDWVYCVTSDDYSSMAIKKNGTLWATGKNTSGQLGLGNIDYVDGWTQVGTDTDWATCCIGRSASLAIKKNGTLWTVGDISCTGLTGKSTDFVQIGTDTDWKTCICRPIYSLALKKNGTLWAVGHNVSGVFGIGEEIQTLESWTQIGIDTWKMVSCSNTPGSSLGIKSDGTLWVTGSNRLGQLGLGLSLRTSVYEWTQVGTDTDWKLCDTGSTAIAIKKNNDIWACGFSEYGLGNGENPDPVTEFTFMPFQEVAIIECTVTFDSTGGQAVEPQTVRKGRYARYVIPVKEGFRFTGWHLNGSFFNFGTPVEEDITLVAQWEYIAQSRTQSGTVNIPWTWQPIQAGAASILMMAGGDITFPVAFDDVPTDVTLGITLYGQYINIASFATITNAGISWPVKTLRQASGTVGASGEEICRWSATGFC